MRSPTLYFPSAFSCANAEKFAANKNATVPITANTVFCQFAFVFLILILLKIASTYTCDKITKNGSKNFDLIRLLLVERRNKKPNGGDNVGRNRQRQPEKVTDEVDNKVAVSPSRSLTC